MAGQLPTVMGGVRGLSLNNKIFMIGINYSAIIILYCSDITGGSGGSYYPIDDIERATHYDSVLQFNHDDGSWSQIGQLKSARGEHGASVVNAVDIIDYCN